MFLYAFSFCISKLFVNFFPPFNFPESQNIDNFDMGYLGEYILRPIVLKSWGECGTSWGANGNS